MSKDNIIDTSLTEDSAEEELSINTSHKKSPIQSTSEVSLESKPGSSKELSVKPSTSKDQSPKPGTSKELSPTMSTSTFEIQNDDIMEFAKSMFKDEGIPVIPKTDCPHLKSVKPSIKDVNINAGCSVCDSAEENWLCLLCYDIFCSRYVNEHMVKHNQETGHAVALSFSDISVWCYTCDDYIDGEALYSVRNLVHEAKFGYRLPFYFNAVNA